MELWLIHGVSGNWPRSVSASTGSFRLTGQSLLRAEWNSNRCNWSTARKKIGPVNRPCDRPIDVISIASLIILVTSRLAGQRMRTPNSEGADEQDYFRMARQLARECAARADQNRELVRKM
jgi:hypothetical protein